MSRYLILLVLFMSCSKEIDDQGFRVFTIPEGKHRSGSYFNHPNDSKIKFKFILDESAEYISEVPRNQTDINKIYGFSDFGKSHFKFSIRIGWRYIPETDNIELCWLRHEDGVHKGETIRNIQPDIVYDATIDIETFWYVIVINNDTTRVIRRPKGNWGLVRRYYLYPYFGGNEFAPHDITIKIKER